MNNVGAFAAWQPEYAAHGIAVFPVGQDKRPAIKSYAKVGIAGSRELAHRFPDAVALGFLTDKRNGIAALDIDTTDERVFIDALRQHGDTPIKIRTASGKYHAWYRHNGERRRIRPFGDLPIDLLGDGGLIVAPPAQTKKGSYGFIEGGLDDLDRLPRMRGLSSDLYKASAANPLPGGVICEGHRNDSLWAYCMRQARHCDDFDALMDVAKMRNEDFIPPLSADEVVRIAKSAWGYETRGENWFGGGGVVPATFADVDELMDENPDAYLLLHKLKRYHFQGETFFVANAMAEKMPGGGWSRKRLAAAREHLIAKGRIELVRRHGIVRGAAEYQWPRSAKPRRGGCLVSITGQF